MTIAIIAGNGDLPKMAISKLQSEKKNFFLVLIDGQKYDNEILSYPHHFFQFGHVGKFLKFSKKNKISKILMIGGVEKPSLSALKFDKIGIILLSKILKKKLFGDDNLLSTIIEFFEKNSLEIISIDQIIDNLLVEKGLLTKIKPNKKNLQDIDIGINALKIISEIDISQSIIIQQKAILAIEGKEGTDELINRSAKLQFYYGEKAVFIKMKKENQNIKVDLPAFGIETVKNLVKGNFAGAAINAGSCLIINRYEVVKYADENDIFIIGV